MKTERRDFLKLGAVAALGSVFSNGCAGRRYVASPLSDRVFDGLAGMHAPLFTPLDADGHVVESKVEPAVEWSIRNGLGGFYVTGGTGEGLALSVAERKRMMKCVALVNRGRRKLIAHVGANRTEDAVELAKAAADMGYDWLAAVRPKAIAGDYDAMHAYYSQIAGATGLPFMIYSWCTPIIPDKDARFFDIPNVRGMKYTGHSAWEVYCLKRRLNKEAIFFAGADEQLMATLTFGSVFSGGIGTTYNIIPQAALNIWRLAQEGRLSEAEPYEAQIIALIEACRTLPRGIAGWKAAMRYIGLDQGFAAPSSPQLSEADYAVYERAFSKLDFLRRV